MGLTYLVRIGDKYIYKHRNSLHQFVDKETQAIPSLVIYPLKSSNSTDEWVVEASNTNCNLTEQSNAGSSSQSNSPQVY